MRPGKGVFDDFVYYLILMFSLSCSYSKYLVELGTCDDQCSSIGKSDYHRVREEIDNNAEFKKSEEKLKYSHKKRKEGGICDKSIRIGCRKWFECRCSHERYDRNRTGRKLSRRSPKCRNHNR